MPLARVFTHLGPSGVQSVRAKHHIAHYLPSRR